MSNHQQVLPTGFRSGASKLPRRALHGARTDVPIARQPIPHCRACNAIRNGRGLSSSLGGDHEQAACEYPSHPIGCRTRGGAHLACRQRQRAGRQHHSWRHRTGQGHGQGRARRAGRGHREQAHRRADHRFDLCRRHRQIARRHHHRFAAARARRADPALGRRRLAAQYSRHAAGADHHERRVVLERRRRRSIRPAEHRPCAAGLRGHSADLVQWRGRDQVAHRRRSGWRHQRDRVAEDAPPVRSAGRLDLQRPGRRVLWRSRAGTQ